MSRFEWPDQAIELEIMERMPEDALSNLRAAAGCCDPWLSVVTCFGCTISR
ncbi:hypothetical protein ABZ777_02370 [Micromonospora parva]|uniref:hypothetical protein n=1 Tax=Micromonospora TaxID=1873 RepID=UPI001EE8A27B|nr:MULTISPECIES: hypothetical protein [Micromonospora]MCG5452525.1 hypothetical protein [Micromonospora hortensis]MCX5118157.1 hypothetical protein [Micromonospora sp. NBC_00362]WTI09662.1 hypothetical protein OHB44_08340 [Micromonospora sp. NBC_00821]